MHGIHPVNYAYRKINPRPYQPRTLGSSGRSPFRQWLLWSTLLIALVVSVIWIERKVYPVQFEIQPAEATMHIEGPHLRYGKNFLIWEGSHTATVAAPGYHTQQVTWQADQSMSRTIHVTLSPTDGELLVVVTPAVKAQVWIDGKHRGQAGAPLIGVTAGSHELQVRAPGFATHRQSVDIDGRGQRTELAVNLQAVSVPAVSMLRSQPPGADVLIDGTYTGQTPIKIERAADTEVQVTMLAPGYTPVTQTLKLKAGKHNRTVTLKRREGMVEIKPVPANATVRINGRPESRRRVRLPQIAHIIEISAPGYVTQTHHVTPHPKMEKIMAVALLSQSQAQQAKRRKFEHGLGLKFMAFHPSESIMLTTTRRQVPLRLTRPFAILDREVTNALYRRYRAAHDSGNYQGQALNRPNQPAVQVDWKDAALFANWLSRQAGVPEFYHVHKDEITGFDANAAGYRLPSEAEWVWLTRSDRRFAWGDTLPPPVQFGNLADQSAADILSPVIDSYNDNAAVSADVGSFQASARGLYDLPGNVAEWVHDVFQDRLRLVTEPEAERVDPLGEMNGRLHVIRGFGWRDGTRKTLGIDLRRYGRDARDDVGFRLAYYLEKP